MVSFRSIRRFVWGEIPESKAERTLLLKIDWFILSYCCLMVRFVYRIPSGKAELNEGAPSISRIVSLAECLLQTRNDAPFSIPDLDRSNVSNAYVSGMKQDLHMYGTEFNVSLLALRPHQSSQSGLFIAESQYYLHMRIHCRDDTQ